MTARRLDGMAVAHAIRAEVRPDVEAFAERTGRPPGLALVLVGNDPASELYVGSKLKSAGETGLRADIERLPASASLDELLHLIDRLNQSDVHDGILVQSPLPAGDGARRRAAGVRRGRAGEGRRRFSSDQRRPAGAGTRGSRRVHAVGRDRAARAIEHPDRRRARGRDRPQRHRRQADGAVAAASACDGHDLSLANRRSCRGWLARPTFSSRRSGGPGSSPPISSSQARR